MTRPSRTGSEREIFIEIVTLGAYAKASAIDSVTGVEISVTGPANADRAALEAAAVRKLEYVLKKRESGNSNPR
jgi:hypothetical protein